MESTASILRGQFAEIQRDTDFGGPKRHFFSRLEMEGLLTFDCIAGCLAELDRLKLTGRHDIRRYASIIRQSSMLVFAALLLDGHEEYIMEFLLHRDSDERLPYTIDGLEYLPPLVRSHFLQRQRQVNPVLLGGDEIHRQIDGDAIIPIVSQTKAGAGGFGTVWKTTIYPTCHCFDPQETAHVGNMFLSVFF